MNELKFRIPENLDLDKVIMDNHEFFKSNKLRRPQLFFICDALANSRASNRKRMENDGSHFSPLSSHVLDGVIYNYNKYIDLLLEAGIFKTDNHFIRGVKSRGYCYNYPFDGKQLKHITIQDYRLAKAQRREMEKYIRARETEMKKYNYLTKWWDSGLLDIDIVAAYEWIDNYRDSKIEEIKEVGQENTDELIGNLINKTEDWKWLVQLIKEKKYYYKFSGVGNRFYNNISNLKTELRQFLSYDSQPLVDLDLTNSQPFFMLALLNPNFWEPNQREEKISLQRLCPDIFNAIKNTSYGESIITLVKNWVEKGDRNNDVTLFRDSVLDGTFYNLIQETFLPLYPDRFESRGKVKSEVLRIFYSNHNRHSADFYAPCITFKSSFPSIYTLFSNIKAVENNFLPLILQRIESYLILDVVCKAVDEFDPQILQLTIHDNIITTKGNEKVIEHIMASEIKRWLGYSPTLKIKDLTFIERAA